MDLPYRLFLAVPFYEFCCRPLPRAHGLNAGHMIGEAVWGTVCESLSAKMANGQDQGQ